MILTDEIQNAIMNEGKVLITNMFLLNSDYVLNTYFYIEIDGKIATASLSYMPEICKHLTSYMHNLYHLDSILEQEEFKELMPRELFFLKYGNKI